MWKHHLAYGFDGMQAVTKKGRGTYQVTLQAGDPVFVRTCHFGYEVEPTCR